MVEFDYEKNRMISLGGPDHNEQLLPLLKRAFQQAKAIDINVSFLMESGVMLILEDLKKAASRNVPIRILCGSYLGITQPSALLLLKRSLPDWVDTRLYNDPNRSFHPKAYRFVYEDHEEIFIGSSNLSRSALTDGIEWNYCLSSKTDPVSTARFKEAFEELFYQHAFILTDEKLEEYSRNWKEPKISGSRLYQPPDQSESETITPRGAQIEALYALQDLRAQGAKKGLVQAATGVGKTYLAAFDTQGFNKILFVAHRQEILVQAAAAFSRVRPELKQGFFTGNQKDLDADLLFASVNSISKKDYLHPSFFKPDAFSYIVIDECHHGVTAMYQRILNYFQPQFLLGLTATPQRMDGRSVYEICDYNVAYEIDLEKAVNQGILSPFHYYGIYDGFDYSKVSFVRGNYDEAQLTRLYTANEPRTNTIFRHFQKHHPKRALGFCVSKVHAQYMADYFNKKGVASAAIYSGSKTDRVQALSDLKKGKLQVVFSVDMLNEGMDIPNVDTVLFLRPTLSPTIFLQQLGRGLRKAEGKDYLTVIDFIGNYKNAGKIPSFLGKTGAANYGFESVTNMKLPQGCIVDFDLKLIDLFEEMQRKSLKADQLILQEYLRIKDLIGAVPTRTQFYQEMDADIFELCRKNSKLNPFRDYQGFLRKIQEPVLSFGKEADEFLNVLETTSMSKVYKMPVLMAFCQETSLRKEVTSQLLMQSWKNFFETSRNWRDLKGGLKKYSEYLTISDKDHLANIRNNPVKFLIKSSNGFFQEGEKPDVPIQLNDILNDVLDDPDYARQVQDIIQLRTLQYYELRYQKESGTDQN